MLRYLSLALCSLILTGVLPAVAETPAFKHEGVARDAERYAAWLAQHYKPSSVRSSHSRSLGHLLLTNGKDPRGASRAFAQAIADDRDSAAAWLGLARALLAIPSNDQSGSERYNIPVNASGAAYTAYNKSQDDGTRGEALAVLARALALRSYWRPALDAYKTSLALRDDERVRRAYDALRSTRGFRILTYDVENETASPRLCITFSEQLLGAKMNYAKFVAVNGRDPETVSQEGARLCIDGLVHGERYEVAVRAGLPAAVDDVLPKTSELAVYVRDRSPTARFTGRNYVLPSRGQAGIPVVSINTAELNIEIFRIGDRSLVSAVANGAFNKQLSSWERDELASTTGEKVYSGKLKVSRKLNEEVTTAIPVGEAVPRLAPGVYAVIAAPADDPRDDGGRLATQWFVVSDLGLTAMSGSNGVHVFVRSLSSTAVIAGASLRLVARNNEVLGRAVTDDKGYARFEPGLAKGEGGLAPALLVAEKSGGDYAFLNMATAPFDLSDRGVKGRPSPGPIDGYIYSERGVYRPGEEVNLTALLRDAGGRAATVPVTIIIARPDGVEHSRYALGDQGGGARTVNLQLAGSATTGTWRVRLHTDPKADPVATAAFLVEDFVPERLALQLEADAKQFTPGKAGTIKVEGKFLYGPPAADLALEGDVIVTASRSDVAGYPGYSFGLEEERIDAERTALEDAGRTDKEGRAELAVQLPQIPRTARPLEARVIVRMLEPGGRVIERDVRLPVAAVVPRIGIKPLFKGSALDEGATAGFDVISLDAQGRRTAMTGLEWELVRLEKHWQWYKRDGSWAYEAVTISRKVAAGKLDTTTASAANIASAVDWGRYRLDVRSSDEDGPASSVLFTAGWFASEDADSPEILPVALDKPSYGPGDEAKLKISSRHGGRALISVLGNGLIATREVDVKAGDDEVAIPVGADWGAGAYVVATLYRPMDTGAKRMPGRAVGVAWLGLDQKPRTLGITMDLPEKVGSGSRLSVPLSVAGLGAGETAYVTVAAVDVGVLNLTRFETPAPESWFYAQRLLGVEYRDLHGRLIDGMRAERGALRSGGDGSGAGMQGNPPVEETLSLFSGIVKTDASGKASVTFDLPDFNGTARIMVVAWSDTKLGHAAGDVIIRDPVAVTASAPRFLTLGDKARLQLDLHNVEGPEADYTVAVTRTFQAGDQPVGDPREVFAASPRLATGERKSLSFDLAPTRIGQVAYDVRITGPDGIDVQRDLLFDVKPPARDVRRVFVSKLGADGGKLAVSNDLLTHMVPGLSKVALNIGPLAAIDVPGLLTQLDRYPYGCAEQTTSRALPLLYANALAVDAGQAVDAKIKSRISEAVARLFAMQDSSGAFGVWGPGNADIWLTAYVTDFLSRARTAGHDVDQRKFNNALDRLQNYVGYVSDFEKGGEKRAYALYVLARNGRAPIGELRYYADTRLERFATPLAKAQLGAALAMMGDKPRAGRAFKAAIADLTDLTATGPRSDYGSALRDGAAVLTLVSEVSMAPEVAPPELADVLAAAFAARTHTSTQEQAWLLLAANALADRGRSTMLDLDGQRHAGVLRRTLSPAQLRDGELTIVNRGSEAVDAVVSVVGAALTPEPAVAHGLTVSRSYYRLDGTKVDIATAAGATSTAAQSDRYVVVLNITTDEPGGRLLLVDRLPAGFEIENPRLVASGDVKALPWLQTSVYPEHTEFRDDRFVAAFDFFQAGDKRREATVAYVVRAVTPGRFVHPAALVEDMYRPHRFARTDAGWLEIAPGK